MDYTFVASMSFGVSCPWECGTEVGTTCHSLKPHHPPFTHAKLGTLRKCKVGAQKSTCNTQGPPNPWSQKVCTHKNILPRPAHLKPVQKRPHIIKISKKVPHQKNAPTQTWTPTLRYLYFQKITSHQPQAQFSPFQVPPPCIRREYPLHENLLSQATSTLQVKVG